MAVVDHRRTNKNKIADYDISCILDLQYPFYAFFCSIKKFEKRKKEIDIKKTGTIFICNTKRWRIDEKKSK